MLMSIKCGTATHREEDIHQEAGCICLTGGGTKEQEIESERQNRQVLTDEQILQLEHMGERSKNISATPRTSNGAWRMARFTSSRAGRSPRYSQSLKQTIEKITFMYLSAISR